MGHFSGLIGIFTLLFIAFLLSENKKSINIKTVSLGLALQFIFAIFILKTPFGAPIFSFLDQAITTLISFSDSGANFLFTSYIDGVGFHPGLVNFAFKTLPTEKSISVITSAYNPSPVLSLNCLEANSGTCGCG